MVNLVLVGLDAQRLCHNIGKAGMQIVAEALDEIAVGQDLMLKKKAIKIFIPVADVLDYRSVAVLPRHGGFHRHVHQPWMLNCQGNVE